MRKTLETRFFGGTARPTMFDMAADEPPKSSSRTLTAPSSRSSSSLSSSKKKNKNKNKRKSRENKTVSQQEGILLGAAYNMDGTSSTNALYSMSLSFHSKASTGLNYSNTVESSPPSKSLVDLTASSASSYSTRSTSFNDDSATSGSYTTATAYTECTSRGTHSFVRRSWSSSNSSASNESRTTDSSALFSDDDESASDGSSSANSQSGDDDDDDNNKNDDKKKEASRSEPRSRVTLVDIAAALDKLQWRRKILSESDRKQPNHTTQNTTKANPASNGLRWFFQDNYDPKKSASKKNPKTNKKTNKTDVATTPNEPGDKRPSLSGRRQDGPSVFGFVDSGRLCGAHLSGVATPSPEHQKKKNEQGKTALKVDHQNIDTMNKRTNDFPKNSNQEIDLSSSLIHKETPATKTTKDDTENRPKLMRSFENLVHTIVNNPCTAVPMMGGSRKSTQNSERNRRGPVSMFTTFSPAGNNKGNHDRHESDCTVKNSDNAVDESPFVEVPLRCTKERPLSSERTKKPGMIDLDDTWDDASLRSLLEDEDSVKETPVNHSERGPPLPTITTTIKVKKPYPPKDKNNKIATTMRRPFFADQAATIECTPPGPPKIECTPSRPPNNRPYPNDRIASAQAQQEVLPKQKRRGRQRLHTPRTRSKDNATACPSLDRTPIENLWSEQVKDNANGNDNDNGDSSSSSSSYDNMNDPSDYPSDENEGEEDYHYSDIETVLAYGQNDAVGADLVP